MSEVSLTDITIHIDKETDANVRNKLDKGLRIIDGVISVHLSDDKPHLAVVEYDPETTTSSHILTIVKDIAGKAEMIGL